MDSGWLVHDGEVLCSLEIASTRADRRHGLLGRDRIDGAMLFPRTRWVHTLAMRFPIDVIHVDGDLHVVAIATMVPWRAGHPVLRARSVIETTAGAHRAWGLRRGSVLEIR